MTGFINFFQYLKSKLFVFLVIENNYRKRNRAETEELNKSLTCPSSERKINFFKSPPSSPSTTYSSPSPSSPSFLTSPLWSLRDNSPCKLDNSFNNASCKSSPLSKVVMHSSFETGVASTFDFVDSDDEMIHESFLVIPTTSTPSTSSLPSRPLKKGRFS